MTVQENRRRPLASENAGWRIVVFSRVFMNERRFRLCRQRKLERNLAFTSSANKRLGASTISCTITNRICGVESK